jgi:hypothetical protein
MAIINNLKEISDLIKIVEGSAVYELMHLPIIV